MGETAWSAVFVLQSQAWVPGPHCQAYSSEYRVLYERDAEVSSLRLESFFFVNSGKLGLLGTSNSGTYMAMPNQDTP